MTSNLRPLVSVPRFYEVSKGSVATCALGHCCCSRATAASAAWPGWCRLGRARRLGCAAPARPSCRMSRARPAGIVAQRTARSNDGPLTLILSLSLTLTLSQANLSPSPNPNLAPALTLTLTRTRTPSLTLGRRRAGAHRGATDGRAPGAEAAGVRVWARARGRGRAKARARARATARARAGV